MQSTQALQFPIPPEHRLENNNNKKKNNKSNLPDIHSKNNSEICLNAPQILYCFVNIIVDDNIYKYFIIVF